VIFAQGLAVNLLGLIAPSTVSNALGVVVQIPIFQSFKTVKAFALTEDHSQIPISKILLNNHILYFPKAVEPYPYALVSTPIAVETSPLALVPNPIVVEFSPLAKVLDPMAVE
jgi:hypothetical protein